MLDVIVAALVVWFVVATVLNVWNDKDNNLS